MDLDRKRAAFRVLRQVLDSPVADRAGQVRSLCGQNPTLVDDVFALLDACDVPLMDDSATYLAERLAAPDDDLIGRRIDGWQVQALLGTGGMGAVYRVQRDGDGYRQQGALKLVKRGMDSQALLARFRRERQILARLEHPHIAGLIDGGITGDGRPYLVMAHIDGAPLLDWAERNGASLDDRLALFLHVCDAVAHAHRQLVVHRDIKPGNILVDRHGDAKLLDFGIAKLLESSDEDTGTVAATRFLSRAYAAPEQTQDGTITTATDIYQLGLVLFELLSGTRHADFVDTTGQRPQRRLALARDQAGAAGPRAIPAQQLGGDLSIIIARATDPDPLRRYHTAAALADDLRRFLAGEPILARADSALYRMRRFVARHRWPVALTTLAALGLAITTALALMQANRAEREARLARAAQDFLVRVFDASAPDSATGAQISARQLLDQGVALIGSELADQPRLRNEMLVTMGRLYRQLGQYDDAAKLLRQARSTPDGSTLDQAAIDLELATVERHRERLDEADRILAAAFAAAGDSEIAPALFLERAYLREIQGRYQDALADAGIASQRNRDLGAAAGPDLIASRQAEALALLRLGRAQDALAVYEETLPQAKTLFGEHDTRLGRLYTDYAGALLQTARPKDAEAAARTAIAIGRARLDANHPAIAQALQILGGALRQQGRGDDAHEALASALAIQRKSLGDVHGDIANSLNSLAILALTRLQNELAETYLREALAIQKTLGQKHAPPTLTMTSNLGTALMRQGRYDEAEPLLVEALQGNRALLGEQHPAVCNSLHSLGQLALEQERAQAAVDYARAAVDLARRVYGRSRELAIMQTGLAAALLQNDDPQPALSMAVDAEQQFVALGADLPRRQQAVLIKAHAQFRLGDTDLASAQVEQVMRESASPSAERVIAHSLLSKIARARGQPVQARRQRRLAQEELARLPAPVPSLRREIERD